MTDKELAFDDESGAILTSKDRFVRSMKSAGRSACREISLDSRQSYASRAYRWLGNLVIGTPEQLGIAGADDFFDDEEDRSFPKGELADDSYEQRKQILLEDFRQDLRYGAAKLVGPVGLLVCAAILMLGQVGIGVTNKVESMSSGKPKTSSSVAKTQATKEDFSSATTAALKAVIEEGHMNGRSTESSLNPREKEALKEYKKRPDAEPDSYPISDFYRGL